MEKEIFVGWIGNRWGGWWQPRGPACGWELALGRSRTTGGRSMVASPLVAEPGLKAGATLLHLLPGCLVCRRFQPHDVHVSSYPLRVRRLPNIQDSLYFGGFDAWRLGRCSRCFRSPCGGLETYGRRFSVAPFHNSCYDRRRVSQPSIFSALLSSSVPVTHSAWSIRVDGWIAGHGAGCAGSADF